jgi:hypothetical protein
MALIPTLLPICSDCESRLETEMVKVSTEKETDFDINLHLDYCRKCNEYKGIEQNFRLDQEKDAVIEKFNHLYPSIKRASGNFIGYEVLIPLKQ